MNRRVKQYLSQQSTQDPLTEEDYLVVKGMIKATSQINLETLAGAIQKDLNPLINNLNTLSKMSSDVNKTSPSTFVVNMEKFKNEEALIEQLRELEKTRLIPKKRVFKNLVQKRYNKFGPIFIIPFIASIVFTFIFYYSTKSFNSLFFLLGGGIWLVIMLVFTIRRDTYVQNCEINYQKIVTHLRHHCYSSTIAKIAQHLNISEKKVLDSFIYFFPGTRSDISSSYYLPQIKTVIIKPVDPSIDNSFDETYLNVIQGMAFLEKEVNLEDLARLLEIAFIPFLRALYSTIATAYLNVKITKNVLQIVPEDLTTILQSLKIEFEKWM